MRTISSKEVAKMLGKRHDNFVRDIRKYIAILGDDAPKYFVEETYTDERGKIRPCYGVTLKGCELIEGRIIGEKRISFIEKYFPLFPPEEEVKVEPVITEVSVEEVAKRLGCTERNVYRVIKKGKLNAIQKEVSIPVIRTFVTVDSLEAYLGERGVV